jgi:hypothetical protein
MAKKVARHHVHRVAKPVRKGKSASQPAVYIHGWMFVVAFALMLGLGAIVGTYFNGLMNEGVPTVAGVSVSR